MIGRRRRRHLRELPRDTSERPELAEEQARAQLHMKFFDQLGPQTRAAIANSRFDPVSPHTEWKTAFMREVSPASPAFDREAAERVRLEDDLNSGRQGQPAAPRGI
jgi:hypothetical protein